MLDLGNLADSMVIWPHIGWLETTGVQEPPVNLTSPSSPLVRQTVMSRLVFSTWIRQQTSIAIYDKSGRQVQSTQVCSGVYFWRVQGDFTHKVILTN
jgi:hypothetical protein